MTNDDDDNVDDDLTQVLFYEPIVLNGGGHADDKELCFFERLGSSSEPVTVLIVHSIWSFNV